MGGGGGGRVRSNLRFTQKIWEGERCKFGSVGKCQNFDIFWNNLDEMKDNLGRECEKEGLISFQGKIGTIAPDSP